MAVNVLRRQQMHTDI